MTSLLTIDPNFLGHPRSRRVFWKKSKSSGGKQRQAGQVLVLSQLFPDQHGVMLDRACEFDFMMAKEKTSCPLF